MFFLLGKYDSQQRKPWSLSVVGENPWMFYKLANEHLSHTAVNIVWSHFSASSCCCCAWCGVDVFIRLSKREVPAAVADPPRACHTPCFHGSPSGSTTGRLCAGTHTTCFFSSRSSDVHPWSRRQTTKWRGRHCVLSLCCSSVLLYKEMHGGKDKKTPNALLIWISHFFQNLFSDCNMCNTVKVPWPPLWET